MFVYDETSQSCLRWSEDRFGGKGRRTVSKGQAAGYLRDDGYWVVNPSDGAAKVHNVVWVIHFGEIPSGFEVDHLDGDSSNNKIGNLRLKTHQANCQNRGRYSNNSTGYTGVNRCVRRGVVYCAALWREDGKLKSKSFSEAKFGELAMNMAVSYRADQIERLNQLGESYTSRHKE